jgi:transposase
MREHRTVRQGRPLSDARSMVEGIMYRYRCEIPWRDLPAVFGQWQTVWTWHRRVAADGTWYLMIAKLTAGGGCSRSALADWSVSWPRRSPARTSTPRISAAIWGLGPMTGLCASTKPGFPLVIVCPPGQGGDCPMRLPLLDRLRATRLPAAYQSGRAARRQGVFLTRDTPTPAPRR